MLLKFDECPRKSASVFYLNRKMHSPCEVQCSVNWPELTEAVDGFRATRGRTLQMSAEISEEQAGLRAQPESWSIRQVLDHIIRAERAFRSYQGQAMERARAGETGTIRIGFREVDTRLRPLPASWMPKPTPILFGLHAVTPFRIRVAVMRKPGPVWAAAPTVAVPGDERSLNELRTDLRDEMQRTLELFERDLPDMVPRVRVAHPLYGSNNLWQMVRLMGAHEERHQHQLRGILKAV